MRRGWTEERVRRELEQLLPGLEEWPPYAFFRQRGAKRLHAEICRRGGPARWAEEYGLPMRWRRMVRWSETEIREALRHTLSGSDIATWPSLHWLRVRGPPGLAHAVKRTGGPQRWAAEFSVPLTTTPQERLERELRDYLADKPEWPSVAQWQRDGRASLLQRVYRDVGAVAWAARLGVPHPRALRRSATHSPTED
jgi:hypothetical protein